MKLKLQSFIICFLFVTTLSFSQTRYLEEVFCDIEMMSDVVYGNNVSILPVLQGGVPAAEDLEMDIYMPAGDIATDRPVAVSYTHLTLPTICSV